MRTAASVTAALTSATPYSICRAALANGLPVDSISDVSVLEPYFYRGGEIRHAS